MKSDNNSSDLAPQDKRCLLQMSLLASFLKDKRRQGLDNYDRAPIQNVVSFSRKADSSQQGFEFLFSFLYFEVYFNPTHAQAEENNNDQAPKCSFQTVELSFLFVRFVEIPNHASQTRRQLATDPEYGPSTRFKSEKDNMDILSLNWYTIGYNPKKLDVDLSGEPVDQSDYRTVKMGRHSSKLDVKENKTALHISSAEAEYNGLSELCQVMWTRTQLQDYGFITTKYRCIADSQSAIAISCKPRTTLRLKHHPYRYHFLKRKGIGFKYLVRRIGMKMFDSCRTGVLDK
ncbi:hypothetical protein Tco_0500534 [Tanacetum coccineum]